MKRVWGIFQRECREREDPVRQRVRSYGYASFELASQVIRAPMATCGERHYSPCQRVWRGRSFEATPEVVQRSDLENLVSRTAVAQSENCHCGEVGMWIEADTEDNRIAGIPSTLRTCPIQQHGSRSCKAP